MTELRLTLPWSCLCSVNQRTNPIRGRQFLTRRYRAALSAARGRVAVQLINAKLFRPNLSVVGGTKVAVELLYWRPDARRRDVGNYDKLVEDAMTGLVYDDDHQVMDRHTVDMGIDRADPRVEITVRVASD